MYVLRVVWVAPLRRSWGTDRCRCTYVQRTWIFVGYACRIAFELGLDKFVEKPPAGETVAQLRDRRNRERTFLVLFVHDRSLSMQTGRPWMIPEVRLSDQPNFTFLTKVDPRATATPSAVRCQRA